MSFAERHKTWLLPLLGVGVLAVAAWNLSFWRGQRTARPEASPDAPTMATLPAPPHQVPLVPTPGRAAPGDLWGDLNALVWVPGALAPDGDLQRIAERALDLEPLPSPPDLSPAWRRLADPKPVGVPVRTTPAPLPVLGFVAQLPSGPVAWLDGLPVRNGQHTTGGWRVVGIQGNRVELDGASGRATLQTTTPTIPPVKEVR